MDINYKIEDIIQTNFDISSYFLIKDIILIIMAVILYNTLDFHWLSVSIQALFIIIVIRLQKIKRMKRVPNIFK